MTFVFITAILAIVLIVISGFFAAWEKDVPHSLFLFSGVLNLILSIVGYLGIKLWLWVTTYVTIAITFNG